MRLVENFPSDRVAYFHLVKVQNYFDNKVDRKIITM